MLGKIKITKTVYNILNNDKLHRDKSENSFPEIKNNISNFNLDDKLNIENSNFEKNDYKNTFSRSFISLKKTLFGKKESLERWKTWKKYTNSFAVKNYKETVP